MTIIIYIHIGYLILTSVERYEKSYRLCDVFTLIIIITTSRLIIQVRYAVHLNNGVGGCYNNHKQHVTKARKLHKHDRHRGSSNTTLSHA